MANIIDPDAIPYGGPMRSDDPYNPRSVTNPLTEPFTAKWNNKPYTLQAGETKVFPEMIAMHVAKHLAQYILVMRTSDKARAEKQGVPTNEVLYSAEDIAAIIKEVVDVDKDIATKLGRTDEPKQVAQLKEDLAKAVEAVSSKEVPSVVRRAGA